MSDSHLLYFVGEPEGSIQNALYNTFIVACPEQAEFIAEEMREAGKPLARVLGEPIPSEEFMEGSPKLVKEFYENSVFEGWLEWEILKVRSDLSYTTCGKTRRLIPGKFIMALFNRPDLPIRVEYPNSEIIS